MCKLSHFATILAFITIQAIHADGLAKNEVSKVQTFSILPVDHIRVALDGNSNRSIAGDTFEFGETKFGAVNAAYDELLKNDYDEITVTIKENGDFTLDNKPDNKANPIEGFPIDEPPLLGPHVTQHDEKDEDDGNENVHHVHNAGKPDGKCEDCTKKKGQNAALLNRLK